MWGIPKWGRCALCGTMRPKSRLRWATSNDRRYRPMVCDDRCRFVRYARREVEAPK